MLVVFESMEDVKEDVLEPEIEIEEKYQVKLVFSKKATKIDKIFTIDLTLTT